MNEKGEGDTSTFVLNGEWHLLGKELQNRYESVNPSNSLSNDNCLDNQCPSNN